MPSPSPLPCGPCPAAGPELWAAEGRVLLPGLFSRRQGRRCQIWGTPGILSTKDSQQVPSLWYQGNDLRALDLAGRPLPGLKGPQAGTCHPSWRVSYPSPASDLPERGMLRVLGRKDRLPGQGKALTFQSPFVSVQLPWTSENSFPLG